MVTRRFLLPLLSALLLFAQQVAVMHAVWHQASGMPLHAAAIEEATQSHDEKQHANPLCSFDAMLGQLLAGGAVASATCVPTVTDTREAWPEVRHLVAFAPPQPRSRGPPSFL